MQAQQHGFAILLVTHTNKNPGACGRKRLNGSGELWDIARNVLIMGHAKNSNKIYVSHEKSSYDAPADTILFTTETVTVKGVETARAKFDSTSDWKDEDFCREKPDRGGSEVCRCSEQDPGHAEFRPGQVHGQQGTAKADSGGNWMQ